MRTGYSGGSDVFCSDISQEEVIIFLFLFFSGIFFPKNSFQMKAWKLSQPKYC